MIGAIRQSPVTFASALLAALWVRAGDGMNLTYIVHTVLQYIHDTHLVLSFWYSITHGCSNTWRCFYCLLLLWHCYLQGTRTWSPTYSVIWCGGASPGWLRDLAETLASFVSWRQPISDNRVQSFVSLTFSFGVGPEIHHKRSRMAWRMKPGCVSERSRAWLCSRSL